jgi:hypothetical protein
MSDKLIQMENALEEVITVILDLDKYQQDIVLQAAREVLRIQSGPSTPGDARRLAIGMGLLTGSHE